MNDRPYKLLANLVNAVEMQYKLPQNEIIDNKKLMSDIREACPDSGASGNIVPSLVGQIYIILLVNYNGVNTNYNLNFSGTVSISKVIDAGLSSLSLNSNKSSYLISSYYSAYWEIYMTYC